MTGLWNDDARPPARAPRSIPDSPEGPLPLIPQVGPRWRSFEEIMARHGKGDRDLDVEEGRNQDEVEGEYKTRAFTTREEWAEELAGVLELTEEQQRRLREWMHARC